MLTRKKYDMRFRQQSQTGGRISQGVQGYKEDAETPAELIYMQLLC
jgi:hypothetical protein